MTLHRLFAALLAAAIALCANAADPAALRGKTMCVIGDSYVRNHKRPYSETWHAKAADSLGMNYVNLGRNGNCIAFDRTAEGFGNPMTERYLDIPDSADVIIVIAGHNDADYLTNHPEVTREQFNAALEELCSGLRSRHPHARIGFVTPWGVARPNFPEVTDDIRQACRRHGFALLDVSDGKIIPVTDDDFRAKYFQPQPDTAHLNDLGHNLMLPAGLDFITSIPCPGCKGGCKNK